MKIVLCEANTYSEGAISLFYPYVGGLIFLAFLPNHLYTIIQIYR